MKKTFLITSEYGIHARPATRLVNLAASFACDVDLSALGRTINLKSIMGLMSLGIYKGEIVTIKTDGEDQEEAIAAIAVFMKKEAIGEEVQA
ncbi:MAG: HPr family phosphocarrier protein [Acholeplasmataceae bacterium]